MFSLIPKLIRVGIIGAVVISLALAFLVYRAVDLFVPYQTDRIVSLPELPVGTSDSEVFLAFSDVASGHAINIHKVTAKAVSAKTSRTLVSFIGNPEGLAAYADNYPAFASESRTELMDVAELSTEDARGIYAFAGSSSQIDAAVEDLQRRGLAVTAETVDGEYIIKVALMDGAFTAVALGVALCLLLCFAFGASRQKLVEAVKSVHGYGPGRIIAAQMAQTVAWYILSAAGGTVLMLPLLYAYNGFQQLPDFLASASLALLMGLAVTMAFEVAVYCFTKMANVPEIINGHRPVALKAVAAGVTQFVATLVIIGSASSLLVTYAAALENAVSAQQWSSQSDIVAVRFGYDLNEQGLDATAEKFAPILASMSQRGSLLVASGAPSATLADGFDPDYGNRIIVNEEYLRRQPVLDAAGNRIAGIELASGEVLLLVPEGFRSSLGDIEASYGEWAEFNNSLPGATPTRIAVRSKLIQNGQRLFNYTDGTAGPNTQIDPILVVVDSSSGTFPSSFFTASASTGGVLFSDASRLQQLIREHDLERTLTSVYSAGDTAAAQAAAEWRSIAASTAALGVLIGVLFLSSVLVASAYGDVTRFSRLSRYVHGYSFVRIHWRAFAVFALVQAGIVLIATTGGLVAPGGERLVLSILALNFVVTAIAVSVLSHRQSTELIRA